MGRLVERIHRVLIRQSQAVGVNMASLRFAEVPRGAIGRLRRVRLHVTLAGALTTSEDVSVLLTKQIRVPSVDPSDLDLEQLKPFWSGYMEGIIELGATDTANIFNNADNLNVDLDFESDLHDPQEQRITGPISNEINGWGLVHFTNRTNAVIVVFISCDLELEWIEDSKPSPAIGWLNDEEQNQE